MQIEVNKLTKEETQGHIELLNKQIKANKREIKQLIADKKPEEAILLTLKNDDIKQAVKVLERGIE